MDRFRILSRTQQAMTGGKVTQHTSDCAAVIGARLANHRSRIKQRQSGQRNQVLRVSFGIATIHHPRVGFRDQGAQQSWTADMADPPTDVHRQPFGPCERLVAAVGRQTGAS
ncbi:hypothetical protein I548_5240 [Mycobacterium intracellulare]|nr:hypothetical protein I548_5240 [Mycobacterium intracellulare]